MQLGTLYPFARQHSHISNSRKEPWQFGEIMLETSKKAIEFRYKILKYYYSLFIRSQNKGTIYKPVFFEFSQDKELLDNEFVYNTQFMIGTELLVIPNVEEGKNHIEGYLPKGLWYDLRNDEKIYPGYRNITAGLGQTAPIFLRDGKTIFFQNVDNVENSFDLKDDFELVVALKEEEGQTQTSEGYIPALNDYNNKQNVENCIQKDCNIKIQTTYDKEKNELKIKFNKPWFLENDYIPLELTKIRVYGIEGVTQFNNYFTSKLRQNNRYFVEKIKASTLNDFTIDFTFKESVKIKEDIEIVIKFI
jgi:alpha-glucosidase/lysosomal alpha-glucosidase